MSIDSTFIMIYYIGLCTSLPFALTQSFVVRIDAQSAGHTNNSLMPVMLTVTIVYPPKGSPQ